MSPALACLRCVGGLELGAMAGAVLECSRLGLPVVVDGFICGGALGGTLPILFDHYAAQRSRFAHLALTSAAIHGPQVPPPWPRATPLL